DLRKTQDLGLSGVPINDKNTDPIITKGYGIYIDPLNPKEYVIYADVSSDPTNPLAVSDQKYSGDPYVRCDGIDQDAHGICKTDCVIDIIDLSKENSSLSIKEIRDVKNNILITFPISINFMPPDPIIKITDNKEPPNFYPTVKIVFKNTDGSERTVLANTSGLINVQTN
ncbi:MAG: hypothetical protein NT094_04650, partial [Candidatus Staskawiczbacteria bacterium]|nr:hypothetical protein [Candidatus Staskawiczbacteria bacterium]